MSALVKIKKSQIKVISLVTFGNILEWFDIYSFAYLVPILSQVFFNFQSELLNYVSAFLVFATGFITRPFGAIIFGRFGDLIGRKEAFVASITIMTIPTFIIGCLPTYNHIGFYAPLLLIFLRLIQSIPASGESPGTFCFLYEYSDQRNRKFMTSWGGFGNQIGTILAIIVTFVMDRWLSNEFMTSWGWRITFWMGGFIGLFGIYLRRKLLETPVFTELKAHQNLGSKVVREILRNHKKTIGLGTSFGVVNAATYYLIATYIPTYFDEYLGLSLFQNTWISLSVLIFTTILLPFFGMLGDRFSVKIFMKSSALTIIILLLPLYFFINHHNLLGVGLIGILFLIPVTCITAFIPYLLTNQLSTTMRYTGVGLTFNLADGIVGGFTPAISLLLVKYTHNQAAFCWFILICALVSLISYFKIKEKHLNRV